MLLMNWAASRAPRVSAPTTCRGCCRSSSTSPSRWHLRMFGIENFASHADQRTRVGNHESSRGKATELKQLSQGSGNDRLLNLHLKLEENGICFQSIIPGQYSGMLCPKCGGGQAKLRSLSVFIREDLEVALWLCIRKQCQWRGSIQESTEGHQDGSSRKQILNPTTHSRFKEKMLGLEPLGEELISYFSERRISVNTLERNGIMQRRIKDQIIIAFPYRRNKLIVNCKYRTLTKRFWQEKGAECIFYGLDDVEDHKDIIIVEGEIDKLSMEEAGYRNCISVLGGSSLKKSREALKNLESNSSYEPSSGLDVHFKQASRIILAVDSDPPGQALAMDLAFCLGAERCWRVKWPRKDDAKVYKDANEVLVSSGRDALRSLIENAEPWLPYRTETSDEPVVQRLIGF